ncbi:MAG TPA: hypothetical protein VGW58_10575 [Pyrinomonadaceae bacterium]|nr:hypothetical protein [Pyrinomonadaceae bacterium]
MRLIAIICLLCVFDPSVLFDHNRGATATREFKFLNVPSPAKDDAAATAKLHLIDGEIDGGSADLSVLIDGRLPSDEDEPGANLFFNAGSSGGRFRMDLGKPIDIAQINSYSWHPNSRGPQLYKLYAAEGSEPKLELDPKRGVDPATRGWKFIALVSTLPQKGEDGGQYGVSVRDSSGSLGKYRYLLFDCYVTELYDNWGNTFYSEIDVIETLHKP